MKTEIKKDVNINTVILNAEVAELREKNIYLNQINKSLIKRIEELQKNTNFSKVIELLEQNERLNLIISEVKKQIEAHRANEIVYKETSVCPNGYCKHASNQEPSSFSTFETQYENADPKLKGLCERIIQQEKHIIGLEFKVRAIESSWLYKKFIK